MKQSSNLNRPKTSLLSTLKISSRIYALGALAVVTAAILSGAYVYGDGIIRQETHIELDFARLEAFEQTIEISSLQLRRQEKAFLLRKDTAHIAGYEKHYQDVETSLGGISTLGVAKPLAANVQRLKEGLAQHRQQFLKVADMHKTLGLNEKLGLKGQLRKAVHNVEKRLKAANLDKLTVKMLMMRRHEKDFMLRGATKYIGRIDKRRVEFDVLLDKAPLSTTEKHDISVLMDAYQRGFRSFAQTASKLVPATEKLSRLFDDLRPDFKALAEAAHTGMKEAERNVVSAQKLTETIFLGAALFTLFSASLFGWAISRSILKPIDQLTDAMKTLAEGDTSVDVPGSETRNELGSMSRAVLVFKQNAVRRAELEAEQKEQALHAETEKRAAMDKLANAFEASVGTIVGTVSAAVVDLNATAQSMVRSSEASCDKANSVAAASEEAAVNVQTVAASAEEMSSSISEINQQIVGALEASKRAVQGVEQTSEQVETLSQTAERVGEVVSLISDIAEQTNLLALNATIESARAGDAGKGFAVVASEVKSLANETAKATEGISRHISEIQSNTSSAVNAIGSIGDIIRQLEGASTSIASAMEEQGAATQEVSRNISEAASGTDEVSSAIEGVTLASRETGEAAGQVLHSARKLGEQADMMKAEIQTFVSNLKVA